MKPLPIFVFHELLLKAGRMSMAFDTYLKKTLRCCPVM